MNDIAYEYAVSLFSLASEHMPSAEKEYLDSLSGIADVFSGEPEWFDLLSSPALTREERNDSIRKVFGEIIPDEMLRFLLVLSDSGNTGSFFGVKEEYEKLYREKCRIVLVHVTSAVEMTEDEKALLTAKMEKKLGKKCEMHFSIDESLIGGAVVEAEGSIIDGSVKRKLAEVKEVIEK